MTIRRFLLTVLLTALCGLMCISGTASAADYDVNDFAWESPTVEVNTPANATVRTGKDVAKLSMCHVNSQKTVIKTWTADKYSAIVGTERVWNISYSFTGAGDREFRFIPYNKNGAEGAGVLVTICVIKPHWDIVNFEWESSVVEVDTPAKATVRTGTAATKLTMCHANSQKTVIKTWTADKYSTVVGAERVWDISYSFKGEGDREFLFIPYNKSGTAGEQVLAGITVSKTGCDITDFQWEYGAVDVGVPAKATVYTGAAVAELKMCYVSANRKAIKTWTADKYSTVTNDGRVWNISYTFTGAGDREFLFVPYDKNGSEGKYALVAITVCKPNYDISYFAWENSSVDAGVPAKATVTTGTAVTKLCMCYVSADRKVIKTWTADKNSTLSQYERVWNISYTFTGAGDREFLFVPYNKNGQEGSPVLAAITVNSAGFEMRDFEWDSEVVDVNKPAGATVITGIGATKLSMCYPYNGQKVIKTWSASQYSTVSGSDRVWKISYSFTGAGEREFYFMTKNSAGAESIGMYVPITVIKPGIEIVSAEFDSGICSKGTPVGITVVTGASAQYLRMYSESGAVVKTWKAEYNTYYTDDCASRVWNVTYTFTGAGSRNLTFKASKDNKTFSKAKSAVILVK